MKRLLLPLLAALALPTAVNAFPFGRDLEVKNTIGERILIKGATVQTFLYGKENYKNQSLLILRSNNLND